MNTTNAPTDEACEAIAMRAQPAVAPAAPAELEILRERIARMGLDVDRALRGEVNGASPLGTGRLQAIAKLAAPAAVAGPALVSIPHALLVRAINSLGSFVSDEGWSQPDMDTLDDLCAEMPAADLSAAAPATQAAPQPAAQQVAMHAAIASTLEELSAEVDAGWTDDAKAALRRLRSLMHMHAAQPQEAAPGAQGDAETALRKVLYVVQRYLPPDGIGIETAMAEIIETVDPWPIGDQKGKA